MNVNHDNFNNDRVKIDNSILDSYYGVLDIESQTVVHCKITAYEMIQHGGWANISPNTYLINQLSNDRLKLIYSENIPYTPHRYFFKNQKDCLYFTLIFPKIPNSWTSFSLYEETSLGCGFFMGEIPKNKSGVYRILLN